MLITILVLQLRIFLGNNFFIETTKNILPAIRLSIWTTKNFLKIEGYAAKITTELMFLESVSD